MRIIAGTLRGRRLQGPESGDLNIRPTSDRAREALFSILQKWPSGAFLDLFAGTGAVALEAWSRGYDPVVCIEKSAGALKLIETNARGTGVRVLKRDACKLRPEAFARQAVIFAGGDTQGKLLGLKPTRRIPVWNGPLEARVLVLDLW